MTWGLLVTVLLLTLHPIAADDFWWQLARGRSVVEGHLAPSQALLLGESRRESDWLGGVPWYLLTELVGIAGTSWLMALSGLVGASALLRVGRHVPANWRYVLIFLGCVAMRKGWEPVPGLVDILGVAAIWGIAHEYLQRPSRLQLVLAAVVSILWANSGVLCVLGLIVTGLLVWQIALGSERQVHWQQGGGLLLVIATCNSLTPRGLFTLLDSTHLLIPWAWCDLHTLQAAGLHDFWTWPIAPELAAFLALSGTIAFLVGTSARLLANAPAFVVIQVLGWSAQANLPAVSIWLTLFGLRLAAQASVSPTIGSEATKQASPHPSRWVMATALAVALAIGGGMWPGTTHRSSGGHWGWGLSPVLELTLLEHALAELPLDGSAHCSGVSEAGMLAWLRPGEIRPYDVPARALLGGRLKEHVRISGDLRAGWADRHRRGDGTWGGWWIPLAERQTRLLLVSPRDTACIRALEDTNWKPLAIDTPCLPYGLAGDQALGSRMVQMLATLEFIEHGAWAYPRPPAGGAGQHTDLRGWITGRHDLALDLQQARTLGAMQRHLAALRVLRYGLQRGNAEARHAFLRNQQALAYREQVLVGRASRWRSLAYLRSGGDPDTPLMLTIPDTEARDWDLAVNFSLAGDPKAALNHLPELDAASLYARGLVFLEAGEPTRAASAFEKLTLAFPDSPESSLARTFQGSLHE